MMRFAVVTLDSIAIHESAHCIVGVSRGAILQSVSIGHGVPACEHKTGGLVCWAPNGHTRFDQICIDVSGELGQARFEGNRRVDFRHRDSCASDIENIQALLGMDNFELSPHFWKAIDTAKSILRDNWSALIRLANHLKRRLHVGSDEFYELMKVYGVKRDAKTC